MKLIYFNAMGRAELARLILAHAGADYEDCRIEKEQWPALKPTMITGTLPVLEVDGVQISQSVAVARFLAKRFKLTGDSDIEMAQADMIVDCIQDVSNEIFRAMFEPNEEQKKELMDNAKTKTKEFLNNMQILLEKNGCGFMVGKKLTWADIAMAAMMERISARHPEALDTFKPLADLMIMVNKCPNIKAWIEKRPKTEF